MVGIQFKEVGSPELAVSVFGKLSANLTGFDEDINFPNTMQVWNGAGYDYYGWAGSSPSSMDPEFASMDNTWLTAGGEVTDEVFTPGCGCWVLASEPGTITLAGEVPEVTTDITVSLAPGWNMVANPYPVEVPISSFGVLSANLLGFDEDINFDNTLQAWQGNGYAYYGWAGTSPSSMDPEFASMDNTWLTSGGEPTSDTIQPGHAVWILAKEAGTITFSALK